MKTLLLIILSLFVLLVLGSCSLFETSSGTSEDCEASVSGAITFREDGELPADAVINVMIEDSSLADAPAKVIGEQTITDPEPGPVPFEVCYDPEDIDERFTYGMRVRIEDSDGNLLWINDTHTPVITNGETEAVEVEVTKVGG